MLKIEGLKTNHYIGIGLLLLMVMLLWPGMINNFFRTRGYEPHGHCYLWDSSLTTLMVTADTVIALAYINITIVLGVFIRRTRGQIPFNWVFVAFGVFIFACAVSHLTDVLTTYLPTYWIAGYVRLVTMFASAVTAIALPKLLPRVVSIVHTAALSQERQTALQALTTELKQQVSDRQKAHEKAQKTVSELRALYNATSILFSANNLDSLGHQIVTTIVEEFDYTDCALMLIDEENNTIERVARTGSANFTTNEPLELDGTGLVPYAIRMQENVYSPDVVEDTNYVANIPGVRSELVIVLRGHKGIIGVLDFQSTELDAFQEDAQRILFAFADRAAAAVENVRLYEQLQHHLTEQENLVLERTSQFREAKDRMEAILNNSSDPILLLDQNGFIQDKNMAFYEKFGFGTDDEVDSLPIVSLVIEEDQPKLLEILQNAGRDQNSQTAETTMIRRNGGKFEVEMIFSPIRKGSNKETGDFVCNLRDITHYKQMEQEIRNALDRERELNEMKSRFSSMISHEFRTPLTIIQTSGELLKKYFERMTQENKDKHLNNINEQVNRMVHMLNDVLTLSKAENVGFVANYHETNLERFCYSIVSEYQQTTKKHQIKFTSNNADRMVEIDPDLLRQAFGNLLSNAIKYTPSGGDVIFDVTCTSEIAIIQIADQGIGIPEQDQKSLFTDYHRSSNVGNISGTGLGLSIVKHAIDAHGGQIELESEEGQGTSFTITIPCVRD